MATSHYLILLPKTHIHLQRWCLQWDATSSENWCWLTSPNWCNLETMCTSGLSIQRFTSYQHFSLWLSCVNYSYSRYTWTIVIFLTPLIDLKKRNGCYNHAWSIGKRVLCLIGSYLLPAILLPYFPQSNLLFTHSTQVHAYARTQRETSPHPSW